MGASFWVLIAFLVFTRVYISLFTLYILGYYRHNVHKQASCRKGPALDESVIISTKDPN
jgi:hypothetical protein